MARQALQFKDIKSKSFRRIIGELETSGFAVDHFHIVTSHRVRRGDSAPFETDVMHINIWRERDDNGDMTATDISAGLGDNAYTLPLADVLAGYEVVSIVADEWHQ